VSEMWNRTLVYLGLREEPEELYEEAPARSEPADDPQTDRPQDRPRSSRSLVGAAAGGRAEDGRAGVRGEDADDERSRTGASGSDRDAGDGAPRGRSSADDSNVRSLRTGDPLVSAVERGSTRASRVALVEVAAFDDVESIGSRFRTGQAVLFDIRAEGQADGQRVVDFVSGLTYAVRGRLTKVGSRAFLLVPEGVELDDDEQRRLRGLGYRLPVAGDA
jgi:cell division inhibitor SepF